MVLELYIENFILIEKEIVAFKKGFNVITGETGAGKSIILGAIDILIGGKFDRSKIRKGSDDSKVGCTLDIDLNSTFMRALSDMGIDGDEGIVIITREIKKEGKSITRVNGRIVPVSILKLLKSEIFEVTTQNDQYELLSPLKRLAVVDSFIGDDICDVVLRTGDAYREISLMRKKSEELEASSLEAEKRMDWLSYQINEIEKANLTDGEDTFLEERLNIINNSKEIEMRCDNVTRLLEGDEGVLVSINKAVKELKMLTGIICEFDEKVEELQGNYYDIEAVCDDIKSTLRNTETGTDDFIRVENRLNVINELKRKYGKTFDMIFSSLETMKDEYDYFNTISEKKCETENKLVALKATYDDYALKLTLLRKKASDKLSDLITDALKELNILNSRFEISVDDSGKMSGLGSDKVEFKASFNLGQEVRPIEKVASGGELSRIMLAIKSIVGDKKSSPVIIFDEIDSGISGITATAVAEKIRSLSSYSQIIAITHLPQIASFGESHFKVEKYENETLNTTSVKIKLLNKSERIDEITRIISGGLSDERSFESARQMLENANKYERRNQNELH